MFIHFDFEGYKADAIPQTSAGIYRQSRMIPPGIHHYFYSVSDRGYVMNEIEGKVILDTDKMNAIHDAMKKLNPEEDFLLKRVNFIETPFQPKPWINPITLEVLIKNCVPRPQSFIVEKEHTERPKTAWSVEVSLFKAYQPETWEIINECFEFDWKCIKKPKLKNSDIGELKDHVKNIYPFVR